MVEAAGVEPASENIPHGRLHTYPKFYFSSFRSPFGRISESLARWISPTLSQALRAGYPASRRPVRIRRKNPAERQP